MILPDVNILIHAINSDSPRHQRMVSWWDTKLSGSSPVYLAWVTVIGFVRFTTSSRLLTRPMTTDESTSYVRSWLEQPCARTIAPLPGHWDLVESLLIKAGTAGNLTTDAHLAALAIQHGCTLYSTDNDFARFEGLRWEIP